MSAGRKHRRAVARHRATEAMRAADQDPSAAYVGALGPFDLWARGPVVFAVARPQPGMPEELAEAVTMANAATIAGRCPGCGARRHVRARPGHDAASGFPHGPGCPAGEADEIAARAGWKRSP